MEQDKLRKYWDILQSAEAYLEGGWQPNRGDPPQTLYRPGAAAGGFDRIRKRLSTADNPVPGSEAVADDSLEKIGQEVRNCRKCRLSENRRNAVPGEGVSNPKLMIIGEAPGAQEDASGRPFVGRAGQYLDKWLNAINLDRRQDVFIGNIIKCRPPDNRDPLPDETAACISYLKRQLDIIRPRAILTLGRISTHILTETTEGIGKLHGRLFQFRGVPLIPTYHPSAVLRNPVYRKPVWADLQKLQRIIEQQE
ncbi:MAG: uracil-DNA glycosylase [Spirochaetota bacterium]